MPQRVRSQYFMGITLSLTSSFVLMLDTSYGEWKYSCRCKLRQQPWMCKSADVVAFLSVDASIT